MKITEIEAIPVLVPKIVFEGMRWTSRGNGLGAINHYIVKVHTDEGIVGYGEGCALQNPSVRYDRLIDDHLAEELIGEDPFNVVKLMAKMEAKEMLLYETTVGPLNVAEEAIEIALYDIMGKKLNTPIYNLLGGLQRDKFPIDWIIGLDMDPKPTGEQAAHFADQGFKVIKLKAGNDIEQDIARVRAVREAVGPEVKIKVDWNQALSPKEAVKVIKRMDEYDLYMAEQPTPAWDLEGMVYVRNNVSVPILADESIWTPHDAMRLVLARAADAFFVYISKSPGLYKSAIISHIADTAGVATAFCNIFGLGIGAAAGLQLSAARQTTYFECGYHGVLFTKDNVDLLAEPLKFEDGQWHVPHGPGLGVVVDDDEIEKYRVKD